MTAVRDVRDRVDHVEARLAWLYPTPCEALEQLEAEVEEILAGAGLPRVFAD